MSLKKGITCALIIRPGSNHNHETVKKTEDRVPITTLDALLDITRLLRGLKFKF
jgi:hypothetical protein